MTDTPPVKYVVEFDYRSDDGPRFVGPFDSKDEASAYVANLNLRVAEWVVAPLAVTEHRMAVVTDTPPVKPGCPVPGCTHPRGGTPPVKPTPLERARDAIRYMEGHVPPDVLADTAVAAALSDEDEMVRVLREQSCVVAPYEDEEAYCCGPSHPECAVVALRSYLLGGES